MFLFTCLLKIYIYTYIFFFLGEKFVFVSDFGHLGFDIEEFYQVGDGNGNHTKWNYVVLQGQRFR